MSSQEPLLYERVARLVETQISSGALRMNERAVFDSTHALIFELIGAGRIDGLRIDHSDGLYDPETYFDWLQRRVDPDGEGTPLYVELPASVVLEVTFTEPGLQGDRSTGGTKPATLETGAQIQVPLFLETGTRVKVDTRDGSYLGRVND